MGEFTIQCTMCDGTFGCEKEYNEHGCDEDSSKTAMKIKTEPQEDDNCMENTLINIVSNELNDDLITIKTEPIDDDKNDDEDFPTECAVEDPLGIGITNNFCDAADVNDVSETLSTEDVNEGELNDGTRKSKRESTFTFLKDFSYKCKICYVVFAKKEEFTKHFRENHKTYRPYECEVCGKKFLHKHYVNLHMRVHTGEKPYVCKLCPRSYSHKTSFTIHMRIHNGERPYACEVCGKKCYDKSGLTSHMRSHTKETPYQCEICGRRFTHSKSLLVHRRNHTGEKPYVCSYCGKAFRHWHKHKIHVRLHTGERPYKCKVCGKGFPRNDEVSRHMRSHQGIKSFKCSICGVYCATQASITGHINLHHSNLKIEGMEPPPEKTLVKDSTSGILGTKNPEPRSLYRLANKIAGYASNSTSSPTTTAKSFVGDTLRNRLSTRVIEVTSKDTPINIPTNAKKSLKKIKCILPKPKSSLDTGEKTMNYQEFLSWQERMLANQGLIVKGYSSTDSKSTTTNSSTATSTKSSNTPTTTTATGGIKISEKFSISEQAQKSLSSTTPNVSKPQYLLLSQGTEGNGTKILLPLNMLDNSSGIKQSLNVPLVAPSTSTSTPAIPGNRSMLLLPHTSNSQPLFLVSNNGQRMLLMASQNINKASPLPTPAQAPPSLPPPKPVIKEETDDIFAPELTIKTEMDYTHEPIPTDFTSIKIKEEPDT